MNTYYVTTAANHPRGSGYWEILASSRDVARRLAFTRCPEGAWAFMYDTLDEVHHMDRKCHGTIGGTPHTSAPEAGKD